MLRSLLFAALTSIGSLAAAQEAWVDVLNGSDTTGAGTAGAPYATIGKGVSSLAAVSGPTTVHVAPGSYGPTTGEAFPIPLRPEMTVRGAGAARTQVSGDGNGVTLFTLDRRSVLADMTLTRADVAIASVATGFASDVRVVRRCVVRDSVIGLHCTDALHSDIGTIVVNSVFATNGVAVVAQSTGYDFQSVSVLLYGTTVTKNGVGLQAGGVLERYLGLYDSIVYGNGSDSITGWSAIAPGITGNVLGDPTYVGTNGNVGTNPNLVLPAAVDAHLRATSPVIDNPAPAVAWPPAPMWLGGSHWIWETSYEEITDLDGDDRIAGANDPGADEFVAPTLYLRGRPRVGTTFHLRVCSAPQDVIPLFASAGLLTTPLGGFFWLQAPIVPLTTIPLDADGLGDVAVPLPVVPAWVGLDAHVQGFRAIGGGAYEGTNPEWIRLLP